MNQNAYLITDEALTVYADGQVYTIHSDNEVFEEAKELVRAGYYIEAIDLMKPVKIVERFFARSTSTRVIFENDTVYYDGEPVHEHITSRALAMARGGFNVEPLLNFVDRVYRNPSFRAQTELLGFLEYGKLPLTSDGHFLAYKRVREDYKDCHSGTIDNSVGALVTMPRNKVDDDSRNTCSYGLHFCSLEYLRGFWGERLMVLKIDPQDVVSIPADYNNTKGRCCRYEVVAELPLGMVEEIDSGWRNAVVYEYEEHDGYDGYEIEEEEEECPYCGYEY